MRIRAAVVADAPAMGRVMVGAWLSAHRGQVPEAAYEQRVAEWTPEVSARGWADTLVELADGRAPRDVVLVAEDGAGHELVGLVSGGPAPDQDTSTAEIGALYVAPDRRGEGIGRALLRAAAAELAGLGFSAVELGVLTANRPAQGFYAAMGGQVTGHRTFDEEGYLLPVTVYGWPDITELTQS